MLDRCTATPNHTTMNTLIAVVPYCLKDHKEATRLLEWIKTLDGRIEHHALVLAADDAVPMDTKKAIDALGKQVFRHCETLLVKAPAPVGENYAVPAAAMFKTAALHIDACYKWNWLWLEPDAVPLRAGWLDALAEAYDQCPKRFMGSLMAANQPNVPKMTMFGTAVYPNCCGPELEKFCDGKSHFDLAMSDYVVPRAQNSELFFHRWGAPNDPPTFKEVKLPTDGPNTGTLDIIPKEAVLFHRCKDSSLIDLLKKEVTKPFTTETHITTPQHMRVAGEEMKRGPGRPRKEVEVV